MAEPLLLWILLSPLVGSLINGIFGKRLPNIAVAMIAICAMAISFICVLVLTFRGDHQAYHYLMAKDWLPIDTNLAITVSLFWDNITQLMTLLITGVGSLIHIYSIGYMSHDTDQRRYFAYLNLFVFFMLMLVLSNSLLTLFVGWEGVGLCSYLLIGFWFDKDANAIAGKKAFIVNRIGDAGFILGMLALLTMFSTLNVHGIAGEAGLIDLVNEPSAWITAICLLLFVGAIGKSAQFPLLVWLPDAMAGPTPVSALIHAATMVTAGVYMVVRLNFMYVLSPIALDFIAAIGIFTAFFAACAAIAQKDIKRVLAYSTVSQLGYMFLALGVGAFGAGMSHLLSHGFYKALLFLGAGSVIHATHGEQSMVKMGGLKNYMIPTTLCFVAGGAALMGFPYITAGWYSKGAILNACYEKGEYIFWIAGLVTAGLTTLYITRLFCRVFLGTPRMDPGDLSRVHESPPVMIYPMGILALLSIIGGFLGIQHIAEGENATHHAHQIIPVVVELLVVLGSLALGWMLYKPRSTDKERLAVDSGLSKAAENGFYLDSLVTSFLGTRVTLAIGSCFRLFETTVIDGTIVVIHYITRFFSGFSSRLQRSNVKAYMISMYVGVLFVLWWVVWSN